VSDVIGLIDKIIFLMNEIIIKIILR